MDQLPRLGKRERELFCLLLFTCNYVVSLRTGFLFVWVLGMGYIIVLWHSLSLLYNFYTSIYDIYHFLKLISVLKETKCEYSLKLPRIM